jgi:hypothetical protein
VNDLDAEAEQFLRNLPHLNTNQNYGGFPFYPWMRKYYQSAAHTNLLTSANQVGKSSINIRKMINWQTNPDIWHLLWPNSHHNVAQFWYLYPTLDVATIEFKKKWEPEWMPRGEMRTHPQYGWEAEYERKRIKAIHWNTGVTTYFKSYAQNATDLQSGSCHAIFCDEELPIHIYDELKFRTSATDGHFHMVFTATLGQYEWECAMEKQGQPEELFKNDSCKIQVSLYDCLEYEDGGPTPWTKERIQKRIDSCSSEAEVKKRIMGRFVQTGEFKYANLITDENLLSRWAYDPKMTIYSAVDPGSGGIKGHPTGMTFLAVNSDCTEGVLFMGWRGDGVATTQADALEQYIKLRGKLNVTTQFYDYHAKDFFVIASRKDEHFTMAEKSHDIGEPILKSLLKYNALKIVIGDVIGLDEMECEFEQGELLKLLHEMRSLKDGEDKRKSKDDLLDTARYNCAKVPWDWEKIASKSQNKEKKVERIIKQNTADIVAERRGQFDRKEAQDEFEQEIGFWNDQYEV